VAVRVWRGQPACLAQGGEQGTARHGIVEKAVQISAPHPAIRAQGAVLQFPILALASEPQQWRRLGAANGFAQVDFIAAEHCLGCEAEGGRGGQGQGADQMGLFGAA